MNKSVILITLLSLIFIVTSQNDIKRPRVLVLLDNIAIKDTHSTFFNDLHSNGYELDIKMITSQQVKLKEYGEYLYDQMILFCGSETDPKMLKQNQILEFYDSGHNILLAGDVDVSKFFRVMANNFGVDFDSVGTRVYDHITAVDHFDGSLFGTTNQIQQSVISPQMGGPILFRGVSMGLTIYENFQVWPILRGNEYTHTKNLMITLILS